MSLSSIKSSMGTEQNKYNYKNFKPEYYDMRNFSMPKAGDTYIDIELNDKDVQKC